MDLNVLFKYFAVGSCLNELKSATHHNSFGLDTLMCQQHFMIHNITFDINGTNCTSSSIWQNRDNSFSEECLVPTQFHRHILTSNCSVCRKVSFDQFDDVLINTCCYHNPDNCSYNMMWIYYSCVGEADGFTHENTSTYQHLVLSNMFVLC